MRSCNGCSLCCDLVPVKELRNRAFEGCQHKRSILHAAGPGCGIYEERPISCRLWFCRWIIEPAVFPERMRPDRVGFVVDEALDLIKLEERDAVVAQIWVAPGHEMDFEQDGPAAGVIRGLCDEHDGVLWRMPPGDRALIFVKKHGEVVGLGAAFTPDWNTVLGPSNVRQQRIAEILAERRR